MCDISVHEPEPCGAHGGEDGHGYESMWLDTGSGEVIIGLKKGAGYVPATADDMAAQMRQAQQQLAIGQPWGEDEGDGEASFEDPCEDFVRRWERSYGG
jgi:hypothetical protein